MSKTILPTNHTPLEKAVDVTIAGRFDYDLPIASFWSADNCPVSFLPFLAWALSVDTWSDTWSEKVKRQVIATSVFVHRHKGTRASLQTALEALDLGVSISEWFEHGGERFTFKADVMVSNRGLSARELQDIFDVIARTKNARSHLSTLRVYLTSRAEPTFAAAAVMGERIDVLPWVATLPPATPATTFAASVHLAETILIGGNYD